MKEQMQGNANETQETISGLSRRKFLTYAGGLAGAGLVLDSCKKDDDDTNPTPSDTLDMGTGDLGLLNYFYVAEQLQAAFYIKLLGSPYANMSGFDTVLLNDIKNHEIAHREFLKNYIISLGGTPVKPLDFDFSKVDFTTRYNAISTGLYLEELAISAYNGAAKLLITQNNVLAITKIVSVEGRHAATIRNMIEWGSFSATTDQNGLDLGKTPQETIPVMQQYIKNKLSGNNLPFN